MWILLPAFSTYPISAVLRLQMNSYRGITSDKDIHVFTNFCPVLMFSPPYVARIKIHKHIAPGYREGYLHAWQACMSMPAFPDCLRVARPSQACSLCAMCQGGSINPLPMKTTWGLSANSSLIMSGWTRASLSGSALILHLDDGSFEQPSLSRWYWPLSYRIWWKLVHLKLGTNCS